VSRKEFTDRVYSFYTHAAGLVVKFHEREASYVVSFDRPDFVERAAELARLWKSQMLVRVVVEPNLDIVSLEAVERAA
jgi:hypothetical protein